MRQTFDRTTILRHPFVKRLWRDRLLIAIVAPVVIYYIIFHYLPMYGVIIAFKQFSPVKGILGSEWVGLKFFRRYFSSVYFWRTIRNTLVISFYGILFGFPVPIMFALMLNELRPGPFKKSIQTISYLPHFISIVVVVGMLLSFLSPNDGIVNVVRKSLGLDPINYISQSRYFRGLYIGSGIWQEFGWNSIIYLAALAGIDASLFEAARIDGASRWQQIWRVTLPCLLPTIVILLILRVGNILNVGFEKIILMYNPATYEVADVISTFTYRQGILSAQYSYGAAVGLFRALINFAILVSVNRFARRVSEVSLW